MAEQKNSQPVAGRSGSMVFGFDRATDETSLAVFLEKIAGRPMLQTLVPRLENHEIEGIVDLFTGLMKKHLSKEEYHRFFLGEAD
ncbi:MAG: hypothetical protein RQ753_00510 [Desulfurivibrionaceae bacterium]|nr:hypothetical protein [Desulfobulbales bacterium]MDT8334157.1 hypothetical protein [Desulfurivibrionaceae bacterium]